MVGATIVCIAVLVLHLVTQPYLNRIDNFMEAMSLVSLSILSAVLVQIQPPYSDTERSTIGALWAIPFAFIFAWALLGWTLSRAPVKAAVDRVMGEHPSSRTGAEQDLVQLTSIAESYDDIHSQSESVGGSALPGLPGLPSGAAVAVATYGERASRTRGQRSNPSQTRSDNQVVQQLSRAKMRGASAAPVRGQSVHNDRRGRHSSRTSRPHRSAKTHRRADNHTHGSEDSQRRSKDSNNTAAIIQDEIDSDDDVFLPSRHNR
jgi:hypothetical protein